MALFLPLALLLGYTLAAQPEATRPRIIAEGVGDIRGAALSGRTLFAWGDRLLSFRLPGGEVTVLDGKPLFPFAGAGCLFDGDRNGAPDFVLAERGPDRALVWLHGPRRVRYVIDTGIETPDVLPAVIHGRRGILVVQKFMQVRFYELPPHPQERWPYREIYSIYTASRQAGLLMADVDGDGREDIFCGNYWIRCPARFDLPWRLFNIETWNETPDSAALRLAAGRRGLFAGQGEMAMGARLAWFEKPADPKDQWTPHRLDQGLGLRYPRALAVSGETLLVGEDAGPDSRLFLFENNGNRNLKPVQIGTGPGFRLAFALDDGGFLTAGGGRITLWPSADTRRLRESSPRVPAKKRR